MANQGLSFRHIRRLEEILVVLVRFGFSDWVDKLRLTRLFRIGWLKKGRTRGDGQESDTASNSERNRWARLRQALETLGPTFVKLGQILSNRADILPSLLVEELSKLQDQVPPFPVEFVDSTIREDFSLAREELFPVFKTEAVASASIAQVHEAYLADGRRVAVKVQRPGIQPLIEQDLAILAFMAKLMHQYLPDMRHFDPKGLVAEFSRQIMKELDFTLERRNMERFALLFRDNKTIHVPRSYESISSRRVITMEFVQGTKLSKILDEESPSFDKGLLARRLAEQMLEQVFYYGFFHADPHPGNVMILPDHVTCFLDFGMMGRIHPDEQKLLVELLLSVAASDYKQVTGALLQLVGHGVHDVPGLEMEIAELLDLYLDQPLGSIDFGVVFQQMVILVQSHKIQVPSKFLLMAKALVIAEGIGNRLSPDFSIMALFEPFVAKMSARRLNPDKLAKSIARKAADYSGILRDFPLESMDLLRAMRKGDLSINFRIRGIEPLRQTLENIGTRLIFGIVLAATLISSSLIIRAEVPPLVSGIPVIGLLGFGLAGIMSIGFLLSIVVKFFRKPGKGD